MQLATQLESVSSFNNDQVRAAYTSGEYLDHNPTWHVEDSPWKARQILSMLQRHSLSIGTVAEVGCGAGEILRQLQLQLPEEVRFSGYDISPQAIQLAKQRSNPQLQFFREDLTQSREHFDLMLMMDVFEHVEDYMGFLRKMRPRSTYSIFHVPLELSVQTVFRAKTFQQARESVGHLHYFSRETALATLRDTGHTILDERYTSWSIELPQKTWKRRLAVLPRKLLAALSQDWASKLIGGFSLLVLTRNEE
ncbi:class I SAM-dependent methyltransferase [Planctomicrobium sp. SH664]|uniref:class I SAM-dependent methyltransferase n=1 Tax=Planctomicrobium sp. SH664 TaxID=3448125 RepID=UPI003F5BD54B